MADQCSAVLPLTTDSFQIEERGISDIKDLLTQEVPGLNFQEVGFGTDIDIQGLGAKHVLFAVPRTSVVAVRIHIGIDLDADTDIRLLGIETTGQWNKIIIFRYCPRENMAVPLHPNSE